MHHSHIDFEVRGDRVLHKPSGAEFWMGEDGRVECGIVPSPYDTEDLKKQALELMRIERGACL